MKTERGVKLGKTLIFVVVFVAFLGVGCASAATYSVCPSGCDYSSIQAAIGAADIGDIIEVHSGTYYENVDVNKTLILKGVDTGTGKPVVDAGGSGSVITLSEDRITLEGFTATNSGDWDEGIRVTSNNNTITGNEATYSGDGISCSSSNNTITGNTVTYNDDGIYLYKSSNNIITGNMAAYNKNGIYLYKSSNNIITGNTARNNINEGIYLRSSCIRNNITGNTASYNDQGIYLASCDRNTVTCNTASYNDYGIYLAFCDRNTITGNTATDNKIDGFYLKSSNNNIITGNTASNNINEGITLFWGSNNNIITSNNASNNNYGIYISYGSSSNNKIYLNNFINNTDNVYHNVYSSDATNIWNSTEEMTYTYDGSTYTNYVGNYWSDYVFAGNDTNNDGIGDMPYRIDGDNDTHPLIEHWENYFAPSEKQPTITLFSPSSSVSNIEGATRTFNVTVDQMVNVSWFINGTVVQRNTSVTSAAYTNTSAVLGTWNVSAIVTNVNGTDMQVWVWNVTKVTPETPEIASYAPDTPVRDSVAATRIFNVTVNQPVNVSWHINGTEVQLNETVTEATYTNQSAANGTWIVSAVVSNANGTAIQTWLWHVGMNQPPIAAFSYSPANPIAAQTITFDASNSTDPDGNITKYEWGFGDGGNTTNTTESITNHTYASAGTFTVNLTVTDNDGATNTTSRAITVSERLVFDTGTGTYPSISGTHNGTITPNVTIVVSKLYTYPCEGTGGHTEHVIIENNTGIIIAEADWDGYQVDGHNISFDVPFTLVANETYSYTIRTGSYPQIIHGTSKAVAGGTINCTSFIDTNGNIYTDWIPAIRLVE